MADADTEQHEDFDPEDPDRETPGQALVRVTGDVDRMRVIQEQRVEAERLHAQLLRAKYVALVESGFDTSQALTIIVQRGLN